MKILHHNKKIYAQIKNSLWPDWSYYNTRVDGDGKYWMLKRDGSDNVHVPLTLLDLPEDEGNRVLCRDILYTKEQTDSIGDTKYTVEKDAVKEKQGWERYINVPDDLEENS